MKDTGIKRIALFDMDGTVLDSMGAWRSLNLLYAQQLGVPLTEENRGEILQLSGSQFVRYFKEHFGVDTDLREIVQRAYASMREQYTRGLPEKPGAKDYLRALGERHVTRVLATATPPDLADIALRTSGLAPYFDIVTTTQRIGLDKSNPAFWLEVARLAGGSAADCVVYEDALYAMEGAHKAGMTLIGITDDTNLGDRAAMETLCTRVISHYDQLR